MAAEVDIPAWHLFQPPPLLSKESFIDKDRADIRDFLKAGIAKDDLDSLLMDMVINNILYFDPTEALYYPQGKSYRLGIRLYFKGLNKKS